MARAVFRTPHISGESKLDREAASATSAVFVHPWWGGRSQMLCQETALVHGEGEVASSSHPGGASCASSEVATQLAGCYCHCSVGRPVFPSPGGALCFSSPYAAGGEDFEVV